MSTATHEQQVTPQPQAEFIPTRETLLERLKDLGDHTSWQDFFNTYSRLMYGVARKAGLTHAEGQDVVQDTVIAVAKHMPGFVYDPAVCSFKSWLLMITRQRIIWQLRKRSPWSTSDARRDDDTRTATVEKIPDPESLNLDAVWDAEWETNLMAAALERVKTRVDGTQFQIFDLYALRNWPPRKVARILDVSIGQVYLARHRVGALLKKEVRRLQLKGRA